LNTLRPFLMALTLAALASFAATAQTTAASNGEAELRALLAMQGDPTRGKTVFTPCEDCHRKDASGRANGIFPRLSGQHGSVIIKQVLDIRAGRRNNPSMLPLVTEAALSSSDLAGVAAYLQGLPIAANNGKGPGTNLVRGKQLYERDCAACHGVSGEGDAAKFYPMVAAQHYRYLLRELIAIRDGSRGNSNAEMVKVVKPYSPAEIEAVSDYMSQLAPPKR
jgi:cytochrome c553